MASSVARLPGDEWRGGAAFGPHAAFVKPVRVRVRDSLRSRYPSPSTASKEVDEEIRCLPQETASATAASAAEKRRQSRILDRWAAQQAREMVTTIQRQAHEAEISALTTVSQPVSARAATFLRDSSPAPSDTSISSFATCSSANPTPAPAPAPAPAAASASAPAPAAPISVTTNLAPNVRASSLIQMWRELEAEAGLSPATPRAVSTTAPASADRISEEPSGSSDVCDDSEAYADSESDMTASQSYPASSSSVTESERGRVCNIVRMLSCRSLMPPPETSLTDDNNEVHSGSYLVPDQRKDCKGSLTLMRVRRRREMEGLLVRLEQERRSELASLVERHLVSRFPYRGRIQSLLRLLTLRQETRVQDKCRPSLSPMELDQMQNRSPISILRQRFQQSPQECCRMSNLLTSSSSYVQWSSSSQVSWGNTLKNSLSNDNNHYKIVSFREIARENPEAASPKASSEESQGESESSDVRWEERNMQMNSNDWQRSSGSSSFLNWQEEDRMEEVEPFNRLAERSDECNWLSSQCESSDIRWEERDLQVSDNCWERPSGSSSVCNQQDEKGIEEVESYNREAARSQECNWLSSSSSQEDERNEECNWLISLSHKGDERIQDLNCLSSPSNQEDVKSPEFNWMISPSNSWRGCNVADQAICNDFIENYPDNVEIHELLERKRVSTSLQSEFRNTMDRLLMSFLHRQGQLSDDEIFVEEYDCPSYWRCTGYDNADEAVASSSLVPLPFNVDDMQRSSFIGPSSQQWLGMEESHDLRCEIAQLRHEISELRNLVKSCVDWQASLQDTIKDQVRAAVCQSNRRERNLSSSKQSSANGMRCCICYEMQIDSLLYRCGHMCTCFKCAHELQWNSGKCPICRAPIIDVVRAYPNS